MTSLPGSALFKSLAIFAAGALIGAISAIQVAPDLTRAGTTVVGQGPATAPTDGTLPTAGPGVTTGPTAGPNAPGNPSSVAGSSFQCSAGRNGGATDKGVSANSVTLATTVVRTGIGAAFLGEVQYAIEAVRNKVNREGGICGRLLQIRYIDDGWEANRGAGYLRNLIEQGVFAIPVGPSSEGLNVVIKNGEIRQAGIPVVGTDGMIIRQYTDPWVWPVAVSTASSARIMAINAYARGARKFSIVFDRTYRFGVEAAEAFNNEVKRLTKAGVPGYNKDYDCQQSFCGLAAGQSSYTSEVNRFQPGEFVAMFLEPATALTWMATPGAPVASTASGGVPVKYGVGAGQPLFTRSFAVNCQSACDQFWVWTGFKPPIENYANDTAVKAFVSDLAKTKPDADEFNQFSEGGYVGMRLLVEAMRIVGPNLTRARLRSALDSMAFDSGLALQGTLRWKPCPNRGSCAHFSAATMQAFAIQFRGTFSGWRTKTLAVDPHPAIETDY
jgi:ABC-type branched-subunit amino acid transport system substrate-binding protein